MSTLKPIQRPSVPADPEVGQRWPQNRCWHSSTSDARHSWQLSLCSQPDRLHQLYKQYFKKRQAKKAFHVFSLWNDPRMLWCWNKYLCQRASIKNLVTAARLWNSCRVSEIPLAANLCVILKGLELLYFLLHLFLHSFDNTGKQMHVRLKVLKCQIKFTAQFAGRVSPEVWQHVLFYSC